jgi:hypothetical protein
MKQRPHLTAEYTFFEQKRDLCYRDILFSAPSSSNFVPADEPRRAGYKFCTRCDYWRPPRTICTVPTLLLRPSVSAWFASGRQSEGSEQFGKSEINRQRILPRIPTNQSTDMTKLALVTGAALVACSTAFAPLPTSKLALALLCTRLFVCFAKVVSRGFDRPWRTALNVHKGLMGFVVQPSRLSAPPMPHLACA